MCNLIYLSTDCPADLRQHDTEGLTFKPEDVPESIPLRYPNRWYVASATGCSCEFRHQIWDNVTNGMEILREPEDWFPEDADQLAATSRLLQVVRDLLGKGYSVDCFDQWDDGVGLTWSASVILPMDRVRDAEFSFIEGCYHSFVMREVAHS